MSTNTITNLILNSNMPKHTIINEAIANISKAKTSKEEYTLLWKLYNQYYDESMSIVQYFITCVNLLETIREPILDEKYLDELGLLELVRDPNSWISKMFKENQNEKTTS